MSATLKTFIARTAFLPVAFSCFSAAAYADVYYQPDTTYQPVTTYQSAPAVDMGQQSVTPPSVAPPVNTVTAGRAGRQARAQQTQDAPASSYSLPLGTRSGIDAALDLSYYHYNEPSPNVELTGPQIGGDLAFTGVFGDHMFDTLEGHLAYGRVDYSQPTDGTSKDHANFTYEIRDLIGKDFLLNHTVSLSPYIGLGYRNLYSDERGITSNGYEGYQRQSQYLYIPMGVKPQFRVDGADVIVTDAEFDYLAHGWQTSHLGDAGFGDPTIHNSQDNGWGGRLSAMWTTPTWSFGPYITYWNINDSAGSIFHSPAASCGSTTCVGTEPRNVTVEGGLQLKYHFLDF
jgi:hypothetical protein